MAVPLITLRQTWIASSVRGDYHWKEVLQRSLTTTTRDPSSSRSLLTSTRQRRFQSPSRITDTYEVETPSAPTKALIQSEAGKHRRTQRSRPNEPRSRGGGRTPDNASTVGAINRLRSGLLVQDLEECWSALGEVQGEKVISKLRWRDWHALVSLVQTQAKMTLEYNQQFWDRCDNLARLMEKEGDGSLLISFLRGVHITQRRYQDVTKIAHRALNGARQTQQYKDGISSHSSKVLRGQHLADLVVLYILSALRQGNLDLKQLISAVRYLTPAKVIFGGSTKLDNDGEGDEDEGVTQDRRGTNGSPLSLERARSVIRDIVRHDSEMAKGNLEEQALCLCRHSIFAWGLDTRNRTSLEGGNYLARRFNVLFTSKDMKSVKMMLDTAREARSIAYGSWLAITHDNDSKADFNDATFSVLLSSLLASGRRDMASQVWSAYVEVRGEDGKTSAKVWNAILDGYARAGDWSSVKSTWDEIKRPDSYAYTTMIAAMFKGRMPDEAMAIFAGMRADDNLGVALPVETLNAVLHGLCYNGRSEQASVLLQEMVSSKKWPSPAISTINTMLRAYGRAGDLENLTNALRNISHLGLEADVITFTTVLDVLLRNGLSDGADDALKKILGIMKQMGVEPNEFTFTAMIKGILHAEGDDAGSFGEGERQPRIYAALSILDQMETMGPAPTEVTYTCIIASLFHAGPRLLGELKRQGTLPATYLHSSPLVVEGLKETHDDVQALADHRPDIHLSLYLIDRLKSRGLTINRKTYHTLLLGLLPSSLQQATSRIGSQRVALVALRRALYHLDEMCASPAFLHHALNSRKVRWLTPAGIPPGVTRGVPRPAPTPSTWTIILEKLVQTSHAIISASPVGGEEMSEGQMYKSEVFRALGEVVERIRSAKIERQDKLAALMEEAQRQLIKCGNGRH